jgi:hypothetical protein
MAQTLTARTQHTRANTHTARYSLGQRQGRAMQEREAKRRLALTFNAQYLMGADFRVERGQRQKH